MIAKSLIIFSLLFSGIGLDGLADRFDNALLRLEYGKTNAVSADDLSIELPDLQKRLAVYKNAPSLTVNAKNVILAEANSDTIIYKNNPTEAVPIASTTKIMTALVALQNYQLSDTVTISTTASQQIGADTFLMPGEKITVLELLHCLLIKSGNDSAYAQIGRASCRERV